MNLSDKWRATSPFHDETHEAVAQTVRRFVEREAAPHIDRWEAERAIPRDVLRRAGEIGILGLGFPEEFGGTTAGVDIFHQLVQIDELCRVGAAGFVASFSAPLLTLPYIINFAPEARKQEIATGVIAGEKVLAIAITEPSGGSDVANLKTRAERRGDHYRINGSKMFISNGSRADYYLVAARTGAEGIRGLSVLLVEKERAGLSHTRLQLMGWHSQDTAAVYFDNVEVPVANILGAENAGFADLAGQFNVERLLVAQLCCSFARVCLEEAVSWARERETFGRKLGEHQVVRVKLANLTRQIEATQAWTDVMAWKYRERKATPAEMAMLKVQATLMFEAVARDAAQVLGGASVLAGSKVERLYREVRIYAIAGGSEEIILDLAGRQLKYG